MIKKPIKVLHVLSSLNVGGTEMFIVNMYRKIDVTRVQFDFAIFSKGKNFFEDEVMKKGAIIHHLDIHCKNKYLQCIASGYSLYKLLKKHDYKIIHIHGCSFFDILRGTIAAKFAKVPVRIAHSHSVGTPNNSIIDNMLRSIMRGLITHTANNYFACSDLAAYSKYSNVNKNEVIIMNNAIDLHKFEFNHNIRKKLRYELGIEDDCIVLGNIGRFEQEKNHEFLIELIRKYKKSNKKTILMLVGDGALKINIKDKAKKLGLEEDVKFIGRVDNPEIYYQVFDVFLLPSLYEGFPFVAVEAQAAGLPCVFSTNMTRDVCILESASMLELSLDAWIEKIKRLTEKKQDRNTINIMRKKGFEIQNQSKELVQYYERKIDELHQ